MTEAEFIGQYQAKTLSILSHSTLRMLSKYSTFSGMSQLSFVSIPKVVSLPSYAFYNCAVLETVNCENITSAYSSMFASCPMLSNIVVPNLDYASYGAFNNLPALTSIYLPNLQKVEGGGVFISCGIEVAELPKLSYLTANGLTQNGIFNSCASLREIRLPNLVVAGTPGAPIAVAVGCSAISHVYLPKCKMLYGAVSSWTTSATDLFSVIDAPLLEEIWMSSVGQSGSPMFELSKLEHSGLKSMYLSMTAGAFPNLSLISFPNLEYLSISCGNWSAFYAVTDIYLPNLKILDMSLPSMPELRSLTIGWSNIKEINGQLFSSAAPVASTITSIALPNCTRITGTVFGYNNGYIETIECAASTVPTLSGYRKLRTVSFPNALNTGTWQNSGYCLAGTNALESAYFPKLQVIPPSMFQQCTDSTVSLNLDFPCVTEVMSSAFYYNYKVRELKLSVCSNIWPSAFYYCRYLFSLYLYSSSMVKLSQNATNIFMSSPMRLSVDGVYGSIYVPASLVDTYKANASWAGVSDRITAIPK